MPGDPPHYSNKGLRAVSRGFGTISAWTLLLGHTVHLNMQPKVPILNGLFKIKVESCLQKQSVFRPRAGLLWETAKKSPNQETGLGNKGHLKVLNNTKLVQMSIIDPLNHLASIWYHTEPLKVSYSPNHFLGWDFFCCFLQQIGSSCIKIKREKLPAQTLPRCNLLISTITRNIHI